jgi:broad specificity phosphatase PhoE
MSEVRWWWVRHAPTGASGAVGWTDAQADLSDHAALDALRDSLPHAPVISSDLSRASATAARIAGARPRLADDPDLREINFGAWEGLSFDAIAARFPADSAAWWENPGPARATGGESFDALVARVGGAIERIHATHPGGDVIVVAHMGVILAALARAGGLAPAQALSFTIGPLSLTRLDWLPAARTWRIVSVNARAHG